MNKASKVNEELGLIIQAEALDRFQQEISAFISEKYVCMMLVNVSEGLEPQKSI